jgi:hypothetical protein
MTDDGVRVLLHFNSGIDITVRVHARGGNAPPTYQYEGTNPGFGTGDQRRVIPFVRSLDVEGVPQYIEAKLDA